MKFKPLLLLALLCAASAPAFAQNAPRVLPPLPKSLPSWLDNRDTNHIFTKRGAYNYDIYNIPALARDLNAISVGHAMAYEDLVTGRAAQLESKTFARIDKVLKNPPKLMPDERAISPTFAKRYGVLEQVFDWTHVLHAQTVDAMASTKLSEAEKEREIAALWRYYFESVPYAISPLPINMALLDGQPYSGAFRRKYPKVNGLFWGYHWLQGGMYDTLWRTSSTAQKREYEVIGARYRNTELYEQTREFMPMFAEVSPRFAAQYPHIANAFDNLHMLHDMVNDILASDWMSERDKAAQIKRAIWMVSDAAHRDCKAGENRGVIDGIPHDHRFFEGMDGMALMPNMTPDKMWTQGIGWMNMSECHHCSMPLPDSGTGENAWQASTVTAEGWSMRVRCALCARDMSAETKGRAVLRLVTQDPLQTLVVIADEQGNLTTDMTDAVFLEDGESHPRCHQWSRAFTNRAAFEQYVRENPKYHDAKALSFAQWAQVENAGTPDTYVREKGPHGAVNENPYNEAAEAEVTR